MIGFTVRLTEGTLYAYCLAAALERGEQGF